MAFRRERRESDRRDGEQDRNVARRQDAEGRPAVRGCRRRQRVSGQPEDDQARAARRPDLCGQPETVVHGGYGLFWAPWNYAYNQHGQIGFARTTTLSQSSAEGEVPLTVLDNPFPAGLLQPVGSALGPPDRCRRKRQLHRSEQSLAECASVFSRPSARAARPHGGDHRLRRRDRARHRIRRDLRKTTAININQIDPAVARQLFPLGSGWDPAKLRESIPNPFFGIAAAGELGTRATIQRGQLLRPVPEFGDLLKHGSDGRQQAPVSRRDLQPRESGPAQACGAVVSATPSAIRRTISSASPISTRGARPRRRTITIWTPSTAPASTTRRTGSSWRRSSTCRPPKIAAASPYAAGGRLERVGDRRDW